MTTGAGIVSGVSLSHQTATVAELEAAAVESQGTAVARLLADPAVSEAYVLQTCNRVEGYVVTDDPAAGRDALSGLTAHVDPAVVTHLDHEASLRHLLRVAAGLESLVIGEDQILGQVRDAFEDARRNDGIGPVLESAVTKAMHVGERARTETAINEGAVSLASAAVQLVDDSRDLDGATALVVGAGEMGRLAATSFATVVDRIIVANRTVPHARHVVETVDVRARAIGLEALDDAIADADVVVSATGSSNPVFTPGDFEAAGDTFVVDIAQPRDVPPACADIAGVTVRDLDALESHTQETRRQRHAAAAKVEDIVEAAFDQLLTQFKRRRADQVISGMYEGAERIKAAEVETALGKLDLDSESEAVVHAMADAIVSQLLAAPTRSLRDAAEEDDWSTIHTALELFDPTDGLDTESDGPAINAADLPPAIRDRMQADAGEDRDD